MTRQVLAPATPAQASAEPALTPPASVAGARKPGLAADLYAISKPRILYLLLVVAWSAMFVQAGGWPAPIPFLAVTVAGAFSVASSGAFNHVLERHRDAKMGRTAERPVASGRLAVRTAVAYGAVTAALSYFALAAVGLPAAALLTVGAIAYYVLVYTVLLKPTTPQNIVIGGLAGSFPALIGWSAGAGDLAVPASTPALLLALLVFLWTPAHFWALALLYKDDYAKADYPMMPNVRGEASTRRQIVAYTVLTAACSAGLVATGDAGWLYAIVATGLGLVFVARSVRLLREPSPKAYRGFFFFTIQYLGLLLLALMADTVVPQPALF